MKIHGVSLQDLYKIYMKEMIITKTMSPLACQCVAGGAIPLRL